jgi:hypothetical protein
MWLRFAGVDALTSIYAQLQGADDSAFIIDRLQINVPGYVRDIAKVQVYCAWAEVLLGEASFPAAVR